MRKFLPLLLGATLLACAAMDSQTDFLSGRRALLRGEPENALSLFTRVAQNNPAFVAGSVAPPRSIWTYVGKAYYNSGRYDSAQSAFEKALGYRSDDQVARLYLGMTLLRPSGAPPPANAFQLQEVTFALREGVEPKRVASLARSRGIGFDLTRETESQLRTAGADNFLIGELRSLRPEAAKGRVNETRRAQGAKELAAALAALATWLNDTIAYSPQGRFWDPSGEIRKQLQLAQKQVAAASWDAAIGSAEWLGYQLEEESDRAARDETAERNREQRR